MAPALIIGSSLLALLLFLFALRQFARGLRARGLERIAARYPPGDVLRTETLAQSFGLRSKGIFQLRGSGVLVLTPSELFFSMYALHREVRIPLSSISGVSLVRSHLGKTQFTDLLRVHFAFDGVDDAIAWRVPDPGAWKTQLDSVRAGDTDPSPIP